MLHAALAVTTVYAILLSVIVGWILGAQIGDDRGVIAVALGVTAGVAGILYTLS